MSNIEYNVKSEHAAEFIHDGEIRDTLSWAREHRNDRALIEEILAKAELGKGISHREAAVLIEVEDKNEFCLGYLIYFFEFACGVSGYVLGVNPFDQPGVEAYKKNMFALLGKPGFEDRKKELEARLK